MRCRCCSIGQVRGRASFRWGRRRRRRGGGERSRIERGEGQESTVQSHAVHVHLRSDGVPAALLLGVCVCVRVFVTCVVSAMAEATTNIELDSSISTDHYSVNQQVRLQQCNGNDPLLHDCSPTCNNRKHCCHFVSNNFIVA